MLLCLLLDESAGSESSVSWIVIFLLLQMTQLLTQHHSYQMKVPGFFPRNMWIILNSSAETAFTEPFPLPVCTAFSLWSNKYIQAFGIWLPFFLFVPQLITSLYLKKSDAAVKWSSYKTQFWYKTVPETSQVVHVRSVMSLVEIPAGTWSSCQWCYPANFSGIMAQWEISILNSSLCAI